MSETPTRTPDREGFPFGHILTDLRGMSIVKMTDIFGFMENLDFESNQSLWSIFPWKWHCKVCIMLLNPVSKSHMHIYDTVFRDTWFSRSPLQIWPYSKYRISRLLRKFLSCGLNFEISAIQKNLWPSAIFPENMSLIGHKLVKLKHFAFAHFYFPLTVHRQKSAKMQVSQKLPQVCTCAKAPKNDELYHHNYIFHEKWADTSQKTSAN